MKIYKTLIIVTVLILAVIGSFYFYKNYHNEKNIEIEKEKPIQQTLPVQSWKVYENTKYGYTIEIPENWYYRSINADLDPAQQGPNPYNIFGGMWYLTPYLLSKEETLTLPVENTFEIVFTVYGVEPGDNYDQIEAKLRYGYEPLENEPARELFNLNGVPAVKSVLTTLDSNSNKNITSYTYTLKDKSVMYSISFSGQPISDENMQIAQRVVSSFRIK